MKHRSVYLCILLSLLLAVLAVQPALAIAGVWNATGSMAYARYYHTIVLLQDGKVLVIGAARVDAELYDPSTGAWTATGSMTIARMVPVATLLPNGKVLVTGGLNNSLDPLAPAELYNPATGTWSSAGSMSVGRFFHTATLLANGKVLVSGGTGPLGTGGLKSAELYDPATNTWTSTGSLNAVHTGHAAVRLLSGEVLVTGGLGSESLAELYDPDTGQWTSTGSMTGARQYPTITLLLNGKVLVTGGASTAELYDPATGGWTETGSPATVRGFFTTTLLPSGKVLAAGGYDQSLGQYLSAAELYDPITGTWSPTSSLITARSEHCAVLLLNGKVLAVGGRGASGALASAELYTSTQLLQPRSNGPQDGWVLETSENSNLGGTINAADATFLLGDTANRRQYRAILHFNTSSLPDNAVITRVVLKIKKQSVTGTDPFTTHGKIAVDIRRGLFSQNAALQPTDFQAAPSLAPAGAFPATHVGGWYSARLSPAAHAFVNLTGITQFRLRFQRDDDNDAVADVLRFHSGNAVAASRPVLVVEYYVP